MDNPALLEVKYERLPLHMIEALRAIQPHPGIQLKHGVGTNDNQNTEEKNASWDTRGIDITLTLLRHLKSFGYGIDLPTGI